MQILVLGGTGAMGVPVVDLCSKYAEVYVTSRKQHDDTANVHYIAGNAHSEDFMRNEVLIRDYDVIIDFMTYRTEEFRNKVDLLLGRTGHYVFLSSSRVYADKNGLITEEDPRHLDVCTDEEYLATDEYALSKARCENILKEKNNSGWTVIRPYITFNSQRLQLGVYEKENWLRRFLAGHTVVVPKDIMSKRTTITFGDDVAKRIANLALSKESVGQVYHITNPRSMLWQEVLDLYDKCLFSLTGRHMKLIYEEDSFGLQKVWSKYQIIYDRLYSRQFDNSKQERICGTDYTDIEEAIEKCLQECINAPSYAPNKIHGIYEGWSDKIAGERSPLKSIPGKKNKLNYMKRRLFKV